MAIAPRVDDYLIETTLTTVLAFAAYLIAERLHFSGVLAVAAAGLVNGNIGPGLEAEELDSAQPEILRAQRGAFQGLRRDGVISEETFEKLVAEIDAELLSETDADGFVAPLEDNV